MVTEIVHGTRVAYNKRGCRCPMCRAANRDYFRVRRAELRKKV